jgi:hypothetical protein
MEMVVSPALGRRPEVTGEDATTSSGPPGSALFRLVLLGALVLALAASLVWVAALRAHRTGAADAVQSDREAAMATTQQFVLRVNTYGPALLDSHGQMPAYRSRVEAVITAKFAASFEQSVPVAEQSVQHYGLARSCAVFSTGVEAVDGDSAQVLVAGSISQTVKNRRGKRVSAGEPTPFRLRVSLDKVGGKWLVDDYAPVTGS